MLCLDDLFATLFGCKPHEYQASAGKATQPSVDQALLLLFGHDAVVLLLCTSCCWLYKWQIRHLELTCFQPLSFGTLLPEQMSISIVAHLLLIIHLGLGRAVAWMCMPGLLECALDVPLMYPPLKAFPAAVLSRGGSLEHP